MRPSKIALILLVTACTSPSMRAEPIASPRFADHHVARLSPQPSSESRHLRVATDQLIRDGELDRGRVSEALRAVASVLEKLTPHAEVDIQRVDLAANALRAPADQSGKMIDGSDSDSLRRLRFGLDAARHALATAPAPAHADVARFLVEVAELRDESAKLTTDLSPAMQYSQVCAAFRAAVRVAFAADGAEAPTFADAGPIVSR